MGHRNLVHVANQHRLIPSELSHAMNRKKRAKSLLAESAKTRQTKNSATSLPNSVVLSMLR
jgi:hypothetical protein